jgi:hypothetical protein
MSWVFFSIAVGYLLALLAIMAVLQVVDRVYRGLRRRKLQAAAAPEMKLTRTA